MFLHSNSIRQAAFAALLLGSFLTSLPASAQECEVKIGAVATMTGGGAAWGLAVKAGTEFQAALANSEGGIPLGNRKCKVKVISVDELCTAAGGAAASNMLTSEGVTAV